MDFIFALPGQTLESVKRDIDIAFSHGANHVAIYPFIDFTYTSRKFSKMPEPEKKKLLEGIVAYCARQGYVRDSIWTFAKPGTPKYSSMIYGSAVRSQYPRARVLAIHTEEARALPGVIGVFTAADVPGKNKVGHLTKDWDTMENHLVSFVVYPV